MGLDTLKVLEAKIEELLLQHAAVCEERDQLREQLAAAQTQSEEAVKAHQQMEVERMEVKARVEQILGRLDGLGLG